MQMKTLLAAGVLQTQTMQTPFSLELALLFVMQTVCWYQGVWPICSLHIFCFSREYLLYLMAYQHLA